MKTTLCCVITFALLLSICSGCECFKTVTIKKGNYLYAYTGGVVGAPLNSYPVTQNATATLKEDGDAVYIKIDANSVGNIGPGASVTASAAGQPIPELRAFSIPPKYFYSAKEGAFPSENRDGLRYSQWRPFVQGLVIPVKFRGPVGNTLAQVEAGPTLALAGGFKYSSIRYNGTKNALGSNANSRSVAFGGFVGTGVVDIKSSTTQALIPDAQASKNAIFPVGLYLVGGINNLNLGIAVGQDFITGPNRTMWNYYHKTWVGIIVGLDIIK